MKMFLISSAVAVVIAVAVYYVLMSTGMDTSFSLFQRECPVIRTIDNPNYSKALDDRWDYFAYWDEVT